MDQLIKKNYRSLRNEDTKTATMLLLSCIFDRGRHALPTSGGEQSLGKGDFWLRARETPAGK